MSTELKRCCRCRQELPATAEFFWRSRGAKCGLQSSCKTCDGYVRMRDTRTSLTSSTRRFRYRNGCNVCLDQSWRRAVVCRGCGKLFEAESSESAAVFAIARKAGPWDLG